MANDLNKMKTFSLDIPVLKETITKLETSIKNIEKIGTDVESIGDRLVSESWDGQATNSFKENQQDWKKGYDEMLNQLIDFKESLEKVVLAGAEEINELALSLPVPLGGSQGAGYRDTISMEQEGIEELKAKCKTLVYEYYEEQCEIMGTIESLSSKLNYSFYIGAEATKNKRTIEENQEKLQAFKGKLQNYEDRVLLFEQEVVDEMSKYAVIDGHKLDSASFREVLKYQNDDNLKALLSKKVDELSDIEKLVIKADYENGNKEKIKAYIENQFHTKDLTYLEMLEMPAQSRKELTIGIAKSMQQIDINLGKDISYNPIPIGGNLSLQVLSIAPTIAFLNTNQNQIKLAQSTIDQKYKNKEISEEESGWLHSILDIFNVLSDYILKSLKQVIMGNFTDDVTVLGNGDLIVVGIVGLNLVGDIRDIIDDIVNWEWSWEYGLFRLLDIVSLLPIVGLINYSDEVYIDLKNIWKTMGDNYEAIKDRLKAIGTEQINGIIKEIAEIASTIDGKVEEFTDDAKAMSEFLGGIVTELEDGLVDLAEDMYKAVNAFQGSRAANIVDSGAELTLDDAAYIAKHVYSVDGIDLTQYEDKRVPVINGWYLVSKEINRSLEIGVYEKTRTDGTKEYVFANAGTEDWEDWENNVQQLVGKSPDMKYSLKYASAFKKSHPDSIITFVGHSKGGAEAAGNAVATNRNAILFNPASLSADAYGLDTSNYGAQMDTYIVDGEILHAVLGPVSRPIGNVQYLPIQSINPITNHGMDAVIEGIEDWRNSQE